MPLTFERRCHALINLKRDSLITLLPQSVSTVESKHTETSTTAFLTQMRYVTTKANQNPKMKWVSDERALAEE